MNKKHIHIFIYTATALLCMLLAACSERLDDGNNSLHSGEHIRLAGDIDQMYVRRVNDNGFCNGNTMGVYVVDYNGGTPGTLSVKGNHGDNVRHTYDESNNKWNSDYDLYWTDKHTHIDIYGYYPYANPTSIDDYRFEVRRDQSTEASNGTLGGYEASDLLWGKISDVAPTASVIRLSLKHRMASARVTLVEGTGFASGEWAGLEKQVLAVNLVRKASVNLADGTVTAAGSVESTATVPIHLGDEWRAIVVPQTVPAATTMFSITIGGVPYKFEKGEAFTYTAGKMSNFSIRVDKRTDTGKFQLTLISESITPWESDFISHDATAREYVVINTTPEELEQAIAAAKLDYTKIMNLKITGAINSIDFKFMKNNMSSLEALNLKEVKITGDEYGVPYRIPSSAMQGTKLTHLVLPDKLKSIGGSAFADCNHLVGSLNIPEGVETIEHNAFENCSGFDGTLTLPSTLKEIEYMAFCSCNNFMGNLILPEGLEVIKEHAFHSCHNFYGELHLPNSLKEIGAAAFSECSGLTGSLTIPQGITRISESAFSSCSFDGNLNLHDGITDIEGNAFTSCEFKGELILPKRLKYIGSWVFTYNQFSGALHLPSSLLSIGENAFAGNSKLTGIVEIPNKITSIKTETFKGCDNIEGLILPANLETIGEYAFSYCYSIGSIVCKGDHPAYVKSGAFYGVPKDNFTVEVPEPAVAQYQTTAGWRDFKRIAAHHELVCSPATATALASRHSQTLTLYAEGEWEVESKPGWCEVSPMSGTNKTKVTITIDAMSKNGSSRKGEVVFSLKDEDYSHVCSVSQYGYQYDEDEWLTLQKATKGRRGVNIVLLGDGYNAQDIASGKYLSDMKEAMTHFFGIEPYTTYRAYFNVYTAFPLSQDSGIGTVNTTLQTRFGTTFAGGSSLKADYGEIFSYALDAPTVDKNNLDETLIIVVPNSSEYGGMTQLWQSGAAISFCPQSTYAYPFDSRGVVQHEAGGHGFGKLGDESIRHNTFIDVCNCSCCQHVDQFKEAKALGWYDNLSLTGKTHNVAWSHLIFDPRYSDIVDMFEGGYMHSRGVFRSEQNSCMSNNIPYYNTISREAIVKRIKRYAGETYAFEDFVSNDKRDAAVADSRNADTWSRRSRAAATLRHSSNSYRQHAPTIHRGSPLTLAKVRKKR